MTKRVRLALFAISIVAVVEPGLNKSQCMDCPPGQKQLVVVERFKQGFDRRCREVAVVER